TKTPASELSSKVKVKKKAVRTIELSDDEIEVKTGEEYIKLLGIITQNRIPIFCSNERYNYLLELACNLDFIASSILGGELDQMMLESIETQKMENCIFVIDKSIIYILYGKFPNKKGYWLIEQMKKNLDAALEGLDPDQLEKIQAHNISLKLESALKYCILEYIKLQEVFSDKKIPFVEDTLKVHYFGLSSQSIGIISLLLGEELPIVYKGPTSSPQEELEIKESLVTAKVEAMAANTAGNTGAMPRWIAVKLGFQNYRFLTFTQLEKDYIINMLSEGNIEKLEKVEKLLQNVVQDAIQTKFHGDLRPFNKLKTDLKSFFEKKVFS
ncbi:MAG: hypothetical protein KAX10_03340, partial [Candidatus Lokiarchaeota archaeon]|nr:hypothetical protein [Candidatus Lokiarchaeota archaeon]